MTIELNTYGIHDASSMDAGSFLAGLDKVYAKRFKEIGDTFSIYEAVASRILKHRNEVAPDSAKWDFAGWTGLFVKIDLLPNEGFDAVHDYYEWLSFQTENWRKWSKGIYRKHDPDGEDYAEIRRRAWTFKVNEHRCTLAAFAALNSEICKQVEVGTQPKYELVCSGSPLPIRAA